MSIYERIRDRRAQRAAEQPGTAGDFEALRGHKYCLLVTFRRDGTPVPTPVWFGLGDARRLYTGSEKEAFKIKRIARDTHARVGPCSVRGKPLGPLVEGRARVLPPEEEARAEQAIKANYGLGRRIWEAVGDRRGTKLRYIEVTPA